VRVDSPVSPTLSQGVFQKLLIDPEESVRADLPSRRRFSFGLQQYLQLDFANHG
jgi:hypothetical protein